MKNRKKRIWLIFILICIAFIFVTFLLPYGIRTFIVQAYKISSGAMKPTLLVGDHILVDKTAALADRIDRKDIVVFTFPVDPSKDIVKRIIGLPGDSIEIRDKALYINGELFKEEYVTHRDPNIFPAFTNSRDNLGPIKVPPNHVFVLGDNRDESFDSRFWGFVEVGELKGRVTSIYWSWDKENLSARWERIGMQVK